MNNSLSQEIRSRAMWCHLSGLTWLLLKVVGFLLLYTVSFFYSSLSSFSAGSPLIGGSLSSLWVIADLLLPYAVPIFVWRINRNSHPFIDIAGKAAINFIFTISLLIVSLMLLGIFMVGATCGIFVTNISSSAMFNALFITFLLIIVLPIILILLFHVGATIYAAFRAYRGEVYSYPMTIKFLK
jgi:uncharacterized protein